MATDARLKVTELYGALWSSTNVATEVCGQHGHKLIQFGSMGTILCEHCGLTLTQINAGRLSTGESNAPST